VFIAAPPGGHVLVTRLPYGAFVPDSSEPCSAAAVVVAWACVGFAAVIAALAQSVLWTIVALVVLVGTVVCTLAVAEHPPFQADSDDEQFGGR
jgi:hypothetical protein